MSFLGGAKPDPFEPGKTERENRQREAEAAGTGKPPAEENDPRKPTITRLAVWLIAGGVGLYFIGSGIYGIITQGG